MASQKESGTFRLSPSNDIMSSPGKSRHCHNYRRHSDKPGSVTKSKHLLCPDQVLSVESPRSSFYKFAEGENNISAYPKARRNPRDDLLRLSSSTFPCSNSEAERFEKAFSSSRSESTRKRTVSRVFFEYSHTRKEIVVKREKTMLLQLIPPKPKKVKFHFEDHNWSGQENEETANSYLAEDHSQDSETIIRKKHPKQIWDSVAKLRHVPPEVKDVIKSIVKESGASTKEGHYERDVANKSASRPHSRKRRATFGIGDSNDFKREQDNNMAGNQVSHIKPAAKIKSCNDPAAAILSKCLPESRTQLSSETSKPFVEKADLFDRILWATFEYSFRFVAGVIKWIVD